MRKACLVIGVFVLAALSLPALGLSKPVAVLWDGIQWKDLPEETKIGYVKGIGNLADYELAVSREGAGLIAKALHDEWKTKPVGQIVQEVDRFYRENPQKVTLSVIEVMLRCCGGLTIP